MTRKELIRYGKDYLCDLTTACCEISDIHKEFVSEAIKSLEQESCEDCISREEIISKISEYADGFGNCGYFSGDSVEDAIMVCVGIADELPSVTPVSCIAKITYNKDDLQKLVDEKVKEITVERKSGNWIKEYDNSTLDGLYHCSVCGRKLWIHNEESVSDYPYCHCGAEMRGVE